MIAIKDKDYLLILDGRAIFTIDGVKSEYSVRDIDKVSILTTEEKIMKSRVFMVIDIEDESYVMGLNHPEFKKILTSDLPKYLNIDFSLVIEAINFRGQKQFTVYKKRIADDTVVDTVVQEIKPEPQPEPEVIEIKPAEEPKPVEKPKPRVNKYPIDEKNITFYHLERRRGREVLASMYALNYDAAVDYAVSAVRKKEVITVSWSRLYGLTQNATNQTWADLKKDETVSVVDQEKTIFTSGRLDSTMKFRKILFAVYG